LLEYSLPYGQSTISFHLPETNQVDVLVPETLEPPQDLNKAVADAIANPIGDRTLSQFDRTAKIGIAINDKTRPIPKPNLVSHLLTYLESLKFDPYQITLFVGSGTHVPMTVGELHRILDKEILSRYPVVIHDCDHTEMVSLGKTYYGTPIKVSRAFYECDLKITVGNIEPHHFMGFSGGVKTAAIGLAARETINANHAMLTRDLTRSGIYSINPMRQDIEEIGRKIDVHFSLGTILNEEKEIVRVYFGQPKLVMETAIPAVRKMFSVSVPEAYDLVIASPGGAPKDINLYQAQKGLTHAARIAKDGGWVLLLAACPEGSGSQSYESFITEVDSHQAVIDQFKSGFFQVGPHKAFQIAKEAVRTNIVLVSEIPPQHVKTWKLTPSQPERLNSLMEWLVTQLSSDARVAILPAATRTMAEVTHAD
jgi:nickel-dependent lactate racemase